MTKRTDRSAVTKKDVDNYVDFLDDEIVKKIYQDARDAYLIIRDTQTDEFQIIADILEVFYRRAKAL